MTTFDPEKFEDKYVHYFPELQRAYKRAFEQMNDRRDSELVHAIDQQVLNESEPLYVPDQDPPFSVKLPDDPHGRLTGVIVDAERFEAILEEYVTELEDSLAAVLLDASEE